MQEKYKRREFSQNELKSLLAGYPQILSPIADFIEAMGFDDMYIENGNVLAIGHLPKVAPFAYAIRLYPALKKEQIRQFVKKHCPTCPSQFITILEHLNGANLDEISIYGIPPYMLDDPPLLNRQTSNPLDIDSAARHWWRDYPGAQEDDFLFGSRNTGWHQQLGYVLKPDSTVVAYPNRAGHYEERRWESIEAWFREELPETLKLREKFIEEVAHESKKRNKNIVYTLRRISFFLRRLFTRL